MDYYWIQDDNNEVGQFERLTRREVDLLRRHGYTVTRQAPKDGDSWCSYGGCLVHGHLSYSAHQTIRRSLCVECRHKAAGRFDLVKIGTAG